MTNAPTTRSRSVQKSFEIRRCALPRGKGSQSEHGRAKRPPRDESFRPQRTPRRDTDQDVLALREEGRSFSAIARQLGVRRAKDVYATFHRTLASRPEGERGELVRRELERLAVLEVRIRSRDATSPEKLARRLEALEHMRRDLH